MGLYKFTYGTVLSRLDPESCHEAALLFLRVASRIPITRQMLAACLVRSDERLAVAAFGLRFPNPLGTAAGFDKNAEAVAGLAAVGFGHVEVGTVTPQPQPGNPKPRIFRLTEDRAIINRMGFPNVGVEAFRRNLQRQARPFGVVVGVSIGKGKDTPLERADEDYKACLSALYQHADYFAINVSSPNTPGLRELQTKALLERLLRSVVEHGRELAAQMDCSLKPLLVKIAPDLDLAQLEDVLEAATQCGLAGIIATNTTLDRPPLQSPRRSEEGGLSGLPLKEPSTRMIREIYKRTGGRLPIIGSGGIFTAEGAWEKLKAGATLLQAYTGFIYEGLRYARQVNTGLLRLMEKAGARSLGEIVGTG